MARNLSTKISDVARSQYESRIIMNSKNNPKTFYLSSVFVKDTDNTFFNWMLNQSNSDTIEALDINRHMIVEAIDKLNISKAPGPDGIHDRIIKECKESFWLYFMLFLRRA